jgi:hypothetical protein
MNQNKKSFLIIFLLVTTLTFSFSALAKKKKKNDESIGGNPRLQNLSKEDKFKFDYLTKEQQNLIENQMIDKGFNKWMVELAIGEPYYATEHHPTYKNYEEVWLYTRPDIKTTVKERDFLDPRSNWPSLHRITITKTCNVNDFFILFDRGVIESIKKAETEAVQGSCRVNKQEAFLPLVNGRPLKENEYIDPKSGKVKKKKKKKK